MFFYILNYYITLIITANYNVFCILVKTILKEDIFLYHKCIKLLKSLKIYKRRYSKLLLNYLYFSKNENSE